VATITTPWEISFSSPPTRSVVEKFGSGASPYEAEKVVWRGDRIEWLLAHGFQDWFSSELASGRAVVPRSV